MCLLDSVIKLRHYGPVWYKSLAVCFLSLYTTAAQLLPDAVDAFWKGFSAEMPCSSSLFCFKEALCVFLTMRGKVFSTLHYPAVLCLCKGRALTITPATENRPRPKLQGFHILGDHFYVPDQLTKCLKKLQILPTNGFSAHLLCMIYRSPSFTAQSY